MKKHDVALVLAVALTAPSAFARQTVQPPIAAKKPHTTTIHGYTLKDDYFWLREKSNPDVIKYLESENAYTEQVMAPTKALQESLYAEMLGRIKQTDLSVPSRIGEYFYYSRTAGGQAVPGTCAARKGSMDGRRGNASRPQRARRRHKFLGLGAFTVSDDGNWLAYTTDTTGYRQYTLHVKDLRSGQHARGEHRARRLGRVGHRQQDAVLHDRGSGLEAIRQVLAPRRGRPVERLAVRGEGRAVRRRRGTLARQEGDLPRQLREDVDGVPLPPGRRRPTPP